MTMTLIPIFCTHEVSPAALSSILSTAYEASNKIDSPPDLVLLTTSDGDELQKYTYNPVTISPVDFDTSQSPFLGWNLSQIVEFLRESTSNTVVDRSTFLVADGQTNSDGDTLLLVHNHTHAIQGPRDLQTVRLSAEYVNSEAIAVSVATKDVGELSSLVGSDGVFRGGRGSRYGGENGLEVKRGGRASRKKLGGIR
ncbi:hypothetical protein BDV06DRAFT_223269 [Aspergillus oleicola]